MCAKDFFTEWTVWHKLWRNLGATENQIQCLILLDVEACIHEEAEEIEVWSPNYPRSLQTVWIGNNEQSVGQIRIHDSKPIAEILSSTHRAPWTRARMWKIQGHVASENAHRYGGRPIATADHKQLTLETFEAAPQWLAERRVNVKWKPLSVSSDMARKSSIFLRVRQTSASPALLPLSDVLKIVQSLYQLTSSIQKQHSPHLRPFV